jgi:F-type H+-transporting ATPase subunit b
MKAFRIVSLFVLVLGLIGATTVLASGGGHEEGPWTVARLIWRVINTLALVALLVYFLKKPLVTFFTERRDQIKKDLDDAREQREKAERLIKDYELKIAGMEQELQGMRAELAKVADAESRKVVANAERMSASMVEAAKTAAEQEVRKARITLKNEAVEMAVQLAETMIRETIKDEDRMRIVDDYLAKVGGMK